MCSSDLGFFYESGDRTSRGFLHSDCFVTLLCNTLYHLPVNSEVHALSLQMIRESARESVAVFQPLQEADGEYRLRFVQMDQHGSPLLERTIALTGFSEGHFDGVRDQLYLLLNESLAGYDGGLRNGWLAVHPVDEERPQQVLQEPHYRQLQEFNRRVTELLA